MNGNAIPPPDQALITLEHTGSCALLASRYAACPAWPAS
jgi:hypothetical protein